MDYREAGVDVEATSFCRDESAIWFIAPTDPQVDWVVLVAASTG